MTTSTSNSTVTSTSHSAVTSNSMPGTQGDSTRTAFVIGPGRSGTTLLYKLLCLHPQVAYLSAIETRLPWVPPEIGGRLRPHRLRSKLKYWFKGGGNAYMPHRPLLQKLIPVPVEGESVYRRHGLPAIEGTNAGSKDGGVTLPAEFERLRVAAGSAVFVSKRTANNRRLDTIDALFPDAKYLNLERDGRDVAASLSRVEWWNEHRLWWDPEQRTPLEVTATGTDMLRLCARNWVEETQAIQQGLARIDPARVFTIRFERLATQPVAEMRRATDFLGLSPSAVYDHVVATVGGGFQAGNWRHRLSAEEIEMVNSEQAEHLVRQGYAP